MKEQTSYPKHELKKGGDQLNAGVHWRTSGKSLLRGMRKKSPSGTKKRHEEGKLFVAATISPEQRVVLTPRSETHQKVTPHGITNSMWDTGRQEHFWLGLGLQKYLRNSHCTGRQFDCLINYYQGPASKYPSLSQAVVEPLESASATPSKIM